MSERGHHLVGAQAPQLIERGKLGTTLIVESLGDKYRERQPVERQCLRWSRTGVDNAPQTLDVAVAAAIEALSPIARAIQKLTSGPGHLATKLILNGWPHAKLREFLPDRLALAHQDLLLTDGALRSPLLGLQAAVAPATAK